jgi:alpha-1,2-mannosyltransferase
MFLIYGLLPPTILFVAYIVYLRVTNASRRNKLLSSLGIQETRNSKVIGFFHPYCNAGGGGERVLWTAIKYMQASDPDALFAVYSGDSGVTKEDIVSKVKSRFDIELDSDRLSFIFLHHRIWIEDSTWRRFTLLGQSIGSIWLGLEAASRLLPDLYMDTMGYAFTFPLFSLLGVRVGAYVHYPTISTEMISRVSHRRVGVTNSSNISKSWFLSNAKLWYYRIFMSLYSASLRRAAFLMVNSTWTHDHITRIVNGSVGKHVNEKGKLEVKIVYPPCDTRSMVNFPLVGREKVILGLAQFRPEKDHITQIKAFKMLVERHPQYSKQGARALSLVLIGGCRDENDFRRVDSLRSLTQDLGVEDQVTFLVNASYQVMLSWLSRASIGLSTMVDEHFGINVVEFMAAGLIPVAHASAGPLLDIVVPHDGEATGYHATDTESFAEQMQQVLELDEEEQLRMRSRARRLAVSKFSEEQFCRGWGAVVSYT